MARRGEVLDAIEPEAVPHLAPKEFRAEGDGARRLAVKLTSGKPLTLPNHHIIGAAKQMIRSPLITLLLIEPSIFIEAVARGQKGRT